MGGERLRIGVVAPPWFSIPPRGYGGIEAVVDLLVRELNARGHDVTLFAASGTTAGATVRPRAGDWANDLGTPDQRVREATYLRRVYAEIRAGGFDLIHDHTEYSGMALAHLLALPIPVVATAHGVLRPKEREFLAEVDDRVGLVAISDAQRRSAPEICWRGVVHNGVDAGAYGLAAQKDRYLVQLARINPDKGQHTAIAVARAAGMPLVLAGKVDRDQRSRDYFDQEIKPALGAGVTWLEEVAGEAKRDLLAKAEAMLFPIDWEEPFGLAMVESMLCGTPVVAHSQGAARELIDEGVTGYLGRGVQELVSLLGEAAKIEPAACRARAAERFSPARMADGYEAIYRRALAA
ncbi:MAG: glycosyltransferase family 4 protein [Candidatus Dormibacteraceae bacterium]